MSTGFTYPHMCRDDHVEIGHSDSEHERCPLCRANDLIEKLVATMKMRWLTDYDGQRILQFWDGGGWINVAEVDYRDRNEPPE